MARSTYYSAYKYEWTLLIERLSTTTDLLQVDFGDERTAEQQRQEWYAFVGALRREMERKTNSEDEQAWYRDLHSKASQIVPHRPKNSGILFFRKKSSTPQAQALRGAIETQLPEPQEDETPEHLIPRDAGVAESSSQGELTDNFADIINRRFRGEEGEGEN